MAGVDESEIHKQIKEQHGVDTSELEFRTVSDQREALIIDVQRVRKYKLLNKDVVVGGAIYDVATGKITPVDC
jgi:carbonic anhydrase